MKIGFYFDYDQTYTFVELFNALKRKDDTLEACGIVVNDRYFSFAYNNLPQKTRLIKFYDVLQKGLAHELQKEDYELLEKFDQDINLTKIMYSDRYLAKYSHDKISKIFAYLIKEFNDFIEEEKIDIFVFNCVASMYSHLLYRLLHLKGVKVLMPLPASINNLQVIANSPYEDFTEIWNYFHELKRGDQILDDFQLEEAKSIMNNIRELKPAYNNLAPEIQGDRFKIPSFSRIVKYLYNYKRYYKNDIGQSTIYERVLQLFRDRKNLKKVNRVFDTVADIKGCRYVYFPLQKTPEITTLVLSQYDQLGIIDLISKQIPFNYKLVIKEHPAMVGQREISFYNQIKKRYPNVAILAPNISSQKLTIDSEVVVTLNGTIIFEAIVLGKPIIFTGKSKYEGFNLGLCSKDFFHFDRLFKEALSIKYDEVDIIYMVASILKHSYDFVFIEPLASTVTTSPQNIKKMADSFSKYINQSKR